VSQDRKEVAEFIADLVRIGADQLVRDLGVDRPQADLSMRAIADQVCVEYARRNIYVPADFDPRNREIVQKYHQASRSAAACSHDRVRELAIEYALSTRWIYTLVKEARQADLAARQGVLPGLDDPSDPAA
jgi:Mor family transcriptional regulator